MEKITKTNAEWQKELSPEAYATLRQGDTESPFTGNLLHNKETGVYECGACHLPLFSSDTKFESGSGWPSFYDVLHKGAIDLVEDKSQGMTRIEVRCSRCGSHLGHLFNDGPNPTGLRYCVNSAGLQFKKATASDANE